MTDEQKKARGLWNSCVGHKLTSVEFGILAGVDLIFDNGLRFSIADDFCSVHDNQKWANGNPASWRRGDGRVRGMRPRILRGISRRVLHRRTLHMRRGPNPAPRQPLASGAAYATVLTSVSPASQPADFLASSSVPHPHTRACCVCAARSA